MHSIDSSHLPQFLQNGLSKKTIIIGNGPSAAEHELGKEIDNFDQVIRINNYVTHNMENRVGSRTDIWVNGANQGLKRRTVIPENILVMIPPVVLKHKGDAIHPRIAKRLGTNNYALLPLEIMSEMESSCGLDRPTTGFFAIYFFYLLGLDVTLHGFDFFVGSTAHYFDSPLKRWLKEKGLIRKAGKHDVSGEKEFVESLIGQEKIKLLTV
ncbi:MAG: glycosyltransferase family 29 protein [Candidatus Marinimicrobia bacterium]|nr:glycosyltransferase family 29 protein [Candidatus Neomarinimicrobiota bacterium]